MEYRIPFGKLVLTASAKARLNDIADSGWVSEGRYVREFEERFAAKFGWKHVIAVSSGTDAGVVVWSSIRSMADVELLEADVITPACAFVATANCLLAAGLVPRFKDIDINTLNLDPAKTRWSVKPLGVQFVATMGKPSPLNEFEIPDDVWLVGDWCEAHGAVIGGVYADGLCDAAIYSYYAAHLVIGGEGGAICTNDDELAEVCRSVKSHGRPLDGYFDFKRIGYNSKWNDMAAAVALGSLEQFDETFGRRVEVREKLLRALQPMEDELILYFNEPEEIVAPHAMPVVLRNRTDGARLLQTLDRAGIQTKTLFGSLPTQHKAFEFLGHKLGDFPVAERVGLSGVHFGCHEFITDEYVKYIAKTIEGFLLD